MNKLINVIAIDGPAGSGKSTVAKNVAEALRYLYIDTGAMYRALTLKAVENKIDLTNERALTALSENIDIALKEENGRPKVYLDGVCVTDKIRDLSISEQVKHIARVEGVRANMARMQRALGENAKGAVMEGRDIGTVVFPDARFKFYLDASFDERVERRYKELKGKGMNVSKDMVKNDLEARDMTDKARKAGPLKKADDAVLIDTTPLSIDDVTKQVLGYINKR